MTDMPDNEKPDFSDDEAIEELYTYSKAAYEEELSKYYRIDNKATKYLSVLTALIGVFSLLGRQIFGDLIPPHSSIQIATFLFAVLLFVGLICSSYLLFKILTLQEIKKVKLDDDMIIFFKTYSRHQILEAISVDYKDATVNNEKYSKEKVRFLTRAYKSIAITAIFLFLFIGCSVINEWHDDSTSTLSGSVQMTTEDKNPNQENTKATENKNTEKSAEPAVRSPGTKVSLENYDNKPSDKDNEILNE